jgi:hypothetical protein
MNRGDGMTNRELITASAEKHGWQLASTRREGDKVVQLWVFHDKIDCNMSITWIADEIVRLEKRWDTGGYSLGGGERVPELLDVARQILEDILTV